MKNTTRGLGSYGRKMGLLRVLAVSFAWIFYQVCSPIRAQASVCVDASSAGTPDGLEASFIASTTNQFLSTVTVNPFVADVYSIEINGINPSFNPPIQNSVLLNDLVSVDTYTYRYGFAAGLDNQRITDSSLAVEAGIACSTPSSFGWQYPGDVVSPCAADMALAAQTISALTASCKTSISETAVFGSSVTTTVNTVGCARIIPVIASYVLALSSQCPTSIPAISNPAADTANCRLITDSIYNTIYDTQFDSSTWVLPVIPQ